MSYSFGICKLTGCWYLKSENSISDFCQMHSLKSLESLLRQKDEIVRSKNEEIDRLKYVNEMLAKRVEATQSELRKSSSFWSLKSYVSSKAIAELPSRDQESSLALQKELELKIQENERLHSDILELKLNLETTQTELESIRKSRSRNSDSVWYYLEVISAY